MFMKEKKGFYSILDKALIQGGLGRMLMKKYL